MEANSANIFTSSVLIIQLKYVSVTGPGFSEAGRGVVRINGVMGIGGLSVCVCLSVCLFILHSRLQYVCCV